MSGIFGGTSFKRKILIKGLQKIKHRGKDDWGIFCDQDVCLGHNHLAIIGLTKQNRQPFKLQRDGDFNVCLILDGKIWNCLDLKKELIGKGHNFFTKSDTEVLLYCYLEWGEDFAKKIDGMFVFAIYDQKNQKIILARDWIGEIPLHYNYDGSKLYFASEIKAFESSFSAKTFPPAHYLVFDLKTKTPVLKKYYKLPTLSINDSFRKATKKIRELLIEGVSKRLISDVPLCALLSGGIDSLLITYILKNYQPDTEAYVISYDKIDKKGDLYYADRAAKWLGIKLNKIFVTQKEVIEKLPEIIYALESYKYYQVYAATANYFLAKRVKKDGYKVAFSGEGSDELWGSYDTTREGAGLPEFKKIRRYLIENIHKGNLNRINKVMLYSGSIEIRSPFLHKPLVEYCLNLPESYITKGGERKYLLKEAFKDYIPLEFLQRPKVTIQDGSGTSDIFKKYILSSEYNKKNYTDIQMIFRDIFDTLFQSKRKRRAKKDL